MINQGSSISSPVNMTVTESLTIGKKTIDEAIIDDLVEMRDFIDYVCKVDPHFAEMWSGYRAKQRILR